VFFWLSRLVYVWLTEYENPQYFKLTWDGEVKLEYCKFNNCYLLALFSLGFSCRNAYHSQNFKPLLCILSKLKEVEEGKTTSYQLAKQCAER